MSSIGVLKGDELHLKKLKTIVDVLDENAIGQVSEKEIKKERRILEKELLETCLQRMQSF